MSPSPSYSFSASQLIAEGRVSGDALAEVSAWSDAASHIPTLSDEQLSLFLLACENRVEETRRCIDAFYRVRAAGPLMFEGRDANRTDTALQLDAVEICIVPERTADNCVVIVHRLADAPAHTYCIYPAMKLLFMALDAALDSPLGPPDGLVFLFDMRLATLRHVARIRVHAIQLFCSYLQDALPVKLRTIHVLNVAWFFDRMLAWLRPFLAEALLDKMILHQSGMDVEQFCEKYVPRSCLPSDLGGTLPPVAELHQETRALLLSLTSHFRAEEQQRNSVRQKLS